jgi:hypothetical protein
MNDDTISKLTYEVDDILAALALKHDISILNLTSIVLARCVLANDFSGSGADYRQLIKEIPPPRPHDDLVVH